MPPYFLAVRLMRKLCASDSRLHQMGGDITVQSELVRGSTFTRLQEGHPWRKGSSIYLFCHQVDVLVRSKMTVVQHALGSLGMIAIVIAIIFLGAYQLALLRRRNSSTS